MTRKDFILIAKTISEVRYNSTEIIYQRALNDLTLNLAAELKRENPRFDIDKFLSACEYGKLPRLEEVA
jgi:hypothetical protein